MSHSHASTPSLPIDPRRNPSYPQRTHVKERADWQAKLAACDQTIEAVRASLARIPNIPDRANFEKLYAQMLGGRDQIADCVRRIPGETGDLYAEDVHRLAQAEEAIQRFYAIWQAQAPK